jgi:hypothetical protein
MRRATWVVTLTVLAIVPETAGLAGCGRSGPARLSPPVPLEQLDMTPYVAAPCGLLRADRAQRRHLTVPGDPVTLDGARACRWRGADAEHPGITVQASVVSGLESVYRDRASYGSFDPTSVTNYPSVLTTAKGHVPGDGTCSARVGVGDNALLEVTADYGTVRSPASSDPCLDADTVAFEIIQQIRSGNP